MNVIIMKLRGYWGDFILIIMIFTFVLLGEVVLWQYSYPIPLNFNFTEWDVWIIPYSHLFRALIIMILLFGGTFWLFEGLHYSFNRQLKNLNFIIFIIALIGVIIPVWWHKTDSYSVIDSDYNSYSTHVFHMDIMGIYIMFFSLILLPLCYLFLFIQLLISKRA